MNEHSEHVVSFLGAAAEFCRIVAARADFDRLTLCRRSLELLSRLVNLALALPNVEPDATDGPPDRLSHDEWSATFGDLVQRLGDAHGYWMVFDPYDSDDHDSIVSSLADDLADVYRDPKNSLPSGDLATNDELWYLKFSFETHRGQHAVDAVKALYCLLYGPHAIAD